MNHQPNHIYEFGHFRLDAAERMLIRDGETIPLQPKAFDLLHVLVEHHGHLLEKDKLLEAVWPDTIVEEVNLANNVSVLRKALGGGGNGGRFIETVPRRGYCFVAPVRKEPVRKTEAIAEMKRWITLSGRDEKFSPDLGYLYAASGRRIEAEKVLNELKELSTRSYVDPLDIARIHLALGEKDQTFAWLEKAYEKRSMGIMWLKVHPQLKSLRRDPRYQDLLRRMRLTQ